MLENITNTINGNLFWAIIILVSSIIGAKLISFIFEKITLKMIKNTKTILDDEIIKALEKPILWIIIIIGLYSSLRYINILDPYTDIINKTFFIIGVFWVVYTLIKVINALFNWYFQELSTKFKIKKIDERYAGTFKRVINIVIYLIAFIIILKHYNVEISPLIASLGIGGLAVALALQDTLANFFSGFYMMGDRTIKVGDYVEIGPELKGYIHDISWRTTKIRTLGGNIITMPNSKLAQSTITNYFTEKPEMSVVITVGVAYWSDLEKVEKITVKVAEEVQKTVEGAVKDFKPFIRYKEFADSNINFSVILRVQDYVKQYKVKHEFIKRLKKAYDKNKIDISFPVRTVIQRKK